MLPQVVHTGNALCIQTRYGAYMQIRMGLGLYIKGLGMTLLSSESVPWTSIASCTFDTDYSKAA